MKIINSINTERYYPFIGGIVAAVTFYKLSITIPSDWKEFLTVIISVASIFAGFIATSIAILMALPSESVIGRFKRSGYINDLALYLEQSLYGTLVFIVFCLLGFYGYQSCLIYSSIVSGFGVYSILCFIRVAALMIKLLKFN
jgi:hypothetical protein